MKYPASQKKSKSKESRPNFLLGGAASEGERGPAECAS